MNPPPPMPHEYGSVTPSTAAAATAASTALPPLRSTDRPARVASRSTVATAPPDPVATGFLVSGPAHFGSAAAGCETSPTVSAQIETIAAPRAKCRRDTIALQIGRASCRERGQADGRRA